MKQGWEMKRLDEVCTFINGRAYNKKELLKKGKYTVLRVGNFFTNNNWYYSDLELPEDKYCDNGDLLYAWSASFGPRIWIGEKVIYHYHIWKVLPDTTLITKEFLFLLLGWDVEKIKSDHGTGTTMMHVSKGSMEARVVPIPPLPEQMRIVAILNEAFTAINTAKENVEKNLENAREIFESYLQNISANSGDEWEEKLLGEIVQFFNGFAFGSKDAIENSKTQLVRMSNLYQNRLDLDRRPVYYPDSFAIKYQKYLLNENDLIISLTGTSGKEDYGYTVRIQATDRHLLLNQRIAKIVITDEGKTDKDYLLHFLLSKTFLAKLYQTANGTRQANLSTDSMKEITITIPNISKQRAIATMLDSLSFEVKNLESIYRQKLENLEELKKSILQKAFNGELP